MCSLLLTLLPGVFLEADSTSNQSSQTHSYSGSAHTSLPFLPFPSHFFPPLSIRRTTPSPFQATCRPELRTTIWPWKTNLEEKKNRTKHKTACEIRAGMLGKTFSKEGWNPQVLGDCVPGCSVTAHAQPVQKCSCNLPAGSASFYKSPAVLLLKHPLLLCLSYIMYFQLNWKLDQDFFFFFGSDYATGKWPKKRNNFHKTLGQTHQAAESNLESQQK